MTFLTATFLFRYYLLIFKQIDISASIAGFSIWNPKVYLKNELHLNCDSTKQNILVSYPDYYVLDIFGFLFSCCDSRLNLFVFP